MQLIQDNFTLPLVGDDFEEGFRGAPKPRAAALDWWQKKLAAIREGRVPHELLLKSGNPQFRRMLYEDFPMRETMTLSDFPNYLLSNTADRALLAGYAEDPPMWTQIARKKVNIDLKDAELYAIDGGEGVLDRVNELGPYPEAALSEARYAGRVFKYGRKFRFSMESFLNDGLNAFNSLPARMGRAVRRTEDQVITSLYATDAAKAAFFTVGNRNIVTTGLGSRTDNPAFSYDGIVDALGVMARQRDADGQPISIQGATIVYPAELEPTALYIRNLIEIRSTDRGARPASADTTFTTISRNALGGLNWAPNHRLSLVAETNGATGWFIFANPNVGRPALVAFSLIGNEAPSLFMKSSNAMVISGGEVSPMMGSFENDDIQYKVRHWFNGIRVDPKSAVFSKGTGAA